MRKTRWERLEEWLIDHEDAHFDAHQLAKSMRVPVGEASNLISGHLTAQRGKKSKTLFVLKRQGRTRNAVWSVGERTADAHLINQTLFTDIDVKIRKAFAPDLNALKARNPRAARRVELTLSAVVDGALAVMAAALNGVNDDH